MSRKPDVFINSECSNGCCDVSVRPGPVPKKGGPNANRGWLVSINGIEKTTEGWGTELGCSSSKVRDRINYGRCVREKRIYVPRARTTDDDHHSGWNHVGNWKGVTEAANRFLRLRWA